MPVTKSAKKALRTAIRRHQENLVTKSAYKQAVKAARHSQGDASLLSSAQSALDRAAKKHAIHPNKAARLKSRLAKAMATPTTAIAEPKKTSKPRTATKKASPKKTVAKK